MQLLLPTRRFWRVRVGICSRLASVKMPMALLLGALPIALVMSYGDVIWGQTSTAIIGHPPVFIAIELHPSGFDTSEAAGISGDQEVGNAEVQFPMGPNHAMLWRSTAESVVDLTPPEASWAFAYATCGDQQVGTAQLGGMGGEIHALLWHGSAASVVDLHPRGFVSSGASGTSGGTEVGSGYLGGSGGPAHALLWRGSAASVVDLHPGGFIFSDALGTSGDEQVGRGIPIGGSLETDNDPGTYHALSWHGSAASVVDLHPHGFTSSFASGVSGGEQVGWGIISPTTHIRHALLWRGTAGSFVDLHMYLPPQFVSSAAFSIDAAGDIVGVAAGSNISLSHAILWKRNGPRPGASRGQKASGC